MSCDESLNYYVTRMAELKSNYDAEIAACESKLSVAESTLINIRENISNLINVCKEEQSKKYTNYAIEELRNYLDWFSINISLQVYCGDEEYQNKINRIKQLIELREQTLVLIEKIINIS